MASAFPYDPAGAPVDHDVGHAPAGVFPANDIGQPVARAALEEAGLVHELVTEPGANHAFFNDTSDRYDPTAAADAWTRTLNWLSTHVG